MTDTQTAPPTTAATSTPRRTTARPTVSVRPAAVGALNAATIAGATAVAAGAGPVLAAGAGILALGATAAGARKKGQSKRERTITITRGGGSTGRGGGLGRSSAASPGSRSAGSRSGGTGSGRSSGGGKSRGAGGRSGGSGSGNGRSASGKSTDGRSGRTRSGGGNTGHRRAGSPPGSRSRSPLTADRVAAARRKLANRRQPGPRLSDAVRSALKPAPTPYGTPTRKPTAREAFAAARRAVTGDNPKKRGTIRRAAAGLLAGAIAADRAQREKWQARKRREAARARLNQRRIERLSNTSGNRVGTAVRRPGTAVTRAAVRKPAPAPVARRANVNSSNPTVDTRGLITMTHPLLAISEDFLAAAARNQPEGMLQVTAEAHLLPQVMENLVKAMKIRFDRAQDHPLHPSIKDMYGLVHKAQVAVQQAAEEIGPNIEKIHEHELNRLRNQRVGEDMWDVARNRGAI